MYELLIFSSFERKSYFVSYQFLQHLSTKWTYYDEACYDGVAHSQVQCSS